MTAGEAGAGRRARDAGPDDTDPRVAALCAAAERLGSELSGYQAPLTDREVAERQLSELIRMATSGGPDGAALRGALLMIAAALGSVSALAPAVAALRAAVELFSGPCQGAAVGRSSGA